MKDKKLKIDTKYITKAAVTTALYVGLTMISASMGLAGGTFQIRISEVLTVLPAFTSAAVPGLFIGCLLSNLLYGGSLLDVILGSIATLVGGIGTYFFRNNKYLAVLMPILSNTIIVPIILIIEIGNMPYWLSAIYIFASEAITAGFLGLMVYVIISKNKQVKRIICDD